jgi:hypothetical protein
MVTKPSSSLILIFFFLQRTKNVLLYDAIEIIKNLELTIIYKVK